MIPEPCKILIAAEVSSLCHLNPFPELHSYGSSGREEEKKLRIIIRGVEKHVF